jgi:hypothetical protein
MIRAGEEKRSVAAARTSFCCNVCSSHSPQRRKMRTAKVFCFHYTRRCRGQCAPPFRWPLPFLLMGKGNDSREDVRARRMRRGGTSCRVVFPSTAEWWRIRGGVGGERREHLTFRCGATRQKHFRQRIHCTRPKTNVEIEIKVSRFPLAAAPTNLYAAAPNPVGGLAGVRRQPG